MKKPPIPIGDEIERMADARAERPGVSFPNGRIYNEKERNIEDCLDVIETIKHCHHTSVKMMLEIVALCNNGITALQGQVSCLANTVSGITKTVVPITAVCPQPMPQYNSWTTPTTGTTTTGTGG